MESKGDKMKNLHNLSIFIVISFLINSAIGGDYLNQIDTEKQINTYKNITDLNIKNVTGDIEIMGAETDIVEVTYIKKAENESKLEEIKVNIEQRGEKLSIDTDMPGSCHRCAVKFYISLPKTMRVIDAQTITGIINCENLEQVDDFKARSTTGSVKGDLAGKDIQISVVTGGITLNLHQVDKQGKIKAETVTGSVKVYVPEDFNAVINLSTITGHIDTDFKVESRGDKKPNKLYGLIGQGEVSCTMSAVTGSLYLGKR